MADRRRVGSTGQAFAGGADGGGGAGSAGARVTGTTGLMLRLLYGSGLRLRVKGVDFDQMQILVCDGNGNKDRVTAAAIAVGAVTDALAAGQGTASARYRRGLWRDVLPLCP